MVADSLHLINAVRKRFNGSILVLGPAPRHIGGCCDEPSHAIKDSLGIKVDMITYTNVFSNQLKRVLKLPKDTYFVDYRQIFGDEFSKDSLCDGVHLDLAHCKKLANTMVKGFDAFLPAPALVGDGDESFAEALQAAEIITPDVKFGDGDGGDGTAEDYNFDDLDFE